MDSRPGPSVQVSTRTVPPAVSLYETLCGRPSSNLPSQAPTSELNCLNEFAALPSNSGVQSHAGDSKIQKTNNNFRLVCMNLLLSANFILDCCQPPCMTFRSALMSERIFCVTRIVLCLSFMMPLSAGHSRANGCGTFVITHYCFVLSLVDKVHLLLCNP